MNVEQIGEWTSVKKIARTSVDVCANVNHKDAIAFTKSHYSIHVRFEVSFGKNDLRIIITVIPNAVAVG